MERKANFALIGLFTFTIIAGIIGFAYWIHHTTGKKQQVAYRVIFDGPVSGLQTGGPVLFNGIRVGEVTSLSLIPDSPSQVVAMIGVNKATPIRSDTKVGLEFTGLTGIASVSLKGVSAATPLIEKEEGEPPTLKAEASASQDVMQAVRDVVARADSLIATNQEAVRQMIADLGTFTAALSRNADGIDEVVNNTKEATASINKLAVNVDKHASTLLVNLDKRTEELAESLDKRTESITVGINRMTSTATRNIDSVGKSIVDLTKNPQRIIFGGGSSSTPAPATGTNRP